MEKKININDYVIITEIEGYEHLQEDILNKPLQVDELTKFGFSLKIKGNILVNVDRRFDSFHKIHCNFDVSKDMVKGCLYHLIYNRNDITYEGIFIKNNNDKLTSSLYFINLDSCYLDNNNKEYICEDKDVLFIGMVNSEKYAIFNRYLDNRNLYLNNGEIKNKEKIELLPYPLSLDDLKLILNKIPQNINFKCIDGTYSTYSLYIFHEGITYNNVENCASFINYYSDDFINNIYSMYKWIENWKTDERSIKTFQECIVEFKNELE